jgi:hypothetical protein
MPTHFGKVPGRSWQLWLLSVPRSFQKGVSVFWSNNRCTWAVMQPPTHIHLMWLLLPQGCPSWVASRHRASLTRCTAIISILGYLDPVDYMIDLVDWLTRMVAAQVTVFWSGSSDTTRFILLHGITLSCSGGHRAFILSLGTFRMLIGILMDIMQPLNEVCHMFICRLLLIRSSSKQQIEGQTEYSVLLYAFHMFHYMCQPNRPSSGYFYIHCPLDSCHYTVASVYN